MTNRNFTGLMLFLALALLMLPLQWVFAAALAAVFHELCHYWAVRLCGGVIFNLNAGVFGAKMEVRGLSHWQELLCALAGPAGSLSLVLLAKCMPRTAVCAGFQGLYNLMPVFPLDGGRALRCFSELFLPPSMAHKLCFVMEWICLIGLLMLGAYACFVLRLGLLPLLWAISVGARSFREKYLANRSGIQYNKLN